jgi:membrane-associated phospholipid phosphatase
MTADIKQEIQIFAPTKRPDKIAAVVSNVAAPPVLALLGAVVLTLSSSTTGAWRWAVFVGITTVLLPTAYVIWQLYRGNISDLHLVNREERLKPYLVTVGGALLGWVICMIWPAPADFRMLAFASCLQAILFMIITLRWKISLHSAAAGSLTVISVSALSTSGLYFALAVPLIAWARVRLQRHTFMQTVAGAILGALVVAFAWYITE